MRRHLAPAGLTALSVLALGALGACGFSGDSTSDDGRLQVVTSTSVYGDVVATIAGDEADVTSIVTGTAQDPHSYEASAQDQLAVSRADLVVANGGGYDAFMATLVDAAGSEDLEVLDASEISGLLPGEEGEEGHEHEEGEAGHEHEGEGGHAHVEGFNEHVWYDLDTMLTVGEEVAEHLGELRPDSAQAFQDNYGSFAGEVEALQERAAALHEAHEGEGVAITEPVPLHLLEDAGLENRTPEEFSEAVEEGSDVSARVLDEVDTVVSSDEVAFLAYNSQTAGPETEQVREAAEQAGTPVVEFTELLPDGESYVEWMSANLDSIEEALG